MFAERDDRNRINSGRTWNCGTNESQLGGELVGFKASSLETSMIVVAAQVGFAPPLPLTVDAAHTTGKSHNSSLRTQPLQFLQHVTLLAWMETERQRLAPAHLESLTVMWTNRQHSMAHISSTSVIVGRLRNTQIQYTSRMRKSRSNYQQPEKEWRLSHDEKSAGQADDDHGRAVFLFGHQLKASLSNGPTNAGLVLRRVEFFAHVTKKPALSRSPVYSASRFGASWQKTATASRSTPLAHRYHDAVDSHQFAPPLPNLDATMSGLTQNDECGER
ncbi:hypothetical protein EV363DRAFT_1418089 [Boletus edulis]|nr:hypothetical protein EV363DRAFT_1418089 [Boletus edulis]